MNQFSKISAESDLKDLITVTPAEKAMADCLGIRLAPIRRRLTPEEIEQLDNRDDNLDMD